MKIEFTQNLSHQNTASESPKSSSSYKSDADYGQHLMQGLERATDYRDERDILIAHLERVEKSTRMTIPLAIRPEFFKIANNLVSHLYLTHTHDKALYQSCFKFLSQINLQIDQTEQTNETCCENEWEELQRAVFLLTEWENALLNKRAPKALHAEHLI